jgi:N-acetylmuramoyl-L-alanine amidase
MSAILHRPSPNWNARPGGIAPTGILLHATAGKSTAGDVEWCCSPKSQVSYHDIIGRDGTCYRLVDPLKRAWHAGVSSFRGQGDCNGYMIGVAFSNDNTGVEPYSEAQLAAGATLVAGYMKRFGIPMDRVTRHKDVALPAGRKTDPAPPAFAMLAFKARVAKELVRV